MDNDGPYIRPCAAFPDGLFLTASQVVTLEDRGLIEQDTWSDNVHPTDDYAAIYGEDEIDTVREAIFSVTGRQGY